MWKNVRDIKASFPLMENGVYTIRIVEGIDPKTNEDIYADYLVSFKKGQFVSITTDDIFDWCDADLILI